MPRGNPGVQKTFEHRAKLAKAHMGKKYPNRKVSSTWREAVSKRVAESNRRRGEAFRAQDPMHQLFLALLKYQDGRCAICDVENINCRKQLHTDHDHQISEETTVEAVRGLLCQDCNLGLGLLGDTLESLKRAVAYLENPPAKQIPGS